MPPEVTKIRLFSPALRRARLRRTADENRDGSRRHRFGRVRNRRRRDGNRVALWNCLGCRVAGRNRARDLWRLEKTATSRRSARKVDAAILRIIRDCRGNANCGSRVD